jgi:hypothetical protein
MATTRQRPWLSHEAARDIEYHGLSWSVAWKRNARHAGPLVLPPAARLEPEPLVIHVRRTTGTIRAAWWRPVAELGFVMGFWGALIWGVHWVLTR